jgi:hypothetical protein
MNILTQRLPGLPVGLLRMMFGILWLQAALQKAPWVINAQGQRFGWLSNWLWTETQHPTFGFYKAMLEHVVLPHFTFFGCCPLWSSWPWGLSTFGLLTVQAVLAGRCGSAILPSRAMRCREWGWFGPPIAPHLFCPAAMRSQCRDLFVYHWLSRTPQAKRALGSFLRSWV